MNNFKKGLIITLLTMLILVGGAYLYFNISYRPLDCCHGEQYESITKGWNKYTNQDYGFVAKYPSDWIVSKSENSNLEGFYFINFGTKENKRQVVIEIYPDQNSIESFLKYFNLMSENWRDTTIDGYPAKILFEDNSGIFRAALLNNGYGYMIYSTNRNAHDVAVAMTQTFKFTSSTIRSQVPEETSIKTGWKVETSGQLGISFEKPNDASVSKVTERKTTDGTTIKEIIITPVGTDSTRVHFFSTNTSIDKVKNIQIYGSANVRNSEFTNINLGGYSGIKRIDHNSYNECTNELMVINKNGTIYGYNIVQCPTHPEGYDQIRKDIANSLKFL